MSSLKNALTASSEHPPLVVIQGPTASGKTALSLALARRFGGEIVNADSLQLVRHFTIGTAKPEPQERALAPHHLFDVLEPDEPLDAGVYVALARPVIADIHRRGRLPVVTGGTGLYVRALLGGLVALPGRDESLRARYESVLSQEGAAGLFALLEGMDPRAGDHIDRDNPRRVVRALEVLELTGRPIWAWQREHAFSQRPYRACVFALLPDMDWLRERVVRRTEAMLSRGFVEEVRGLVARYPVQAKPFGAIGYAQIVEMLAGEFPPAELAGRIVTATMQYAKKQLRWLRTEPDLFWLAPGEHDRALSHLSRWLGTATG